MANYFNSRSNRTSSQTRLIERAAQQELTFTPAVSASSCAQIAPLADTVDIHVPAAASSVMHNIEDASKLAVEARERAEQLVTTEIPEAVKLFEEKYGHYRQRIKEIADTGEMVRVPYPKDWMKWDDWAESAYDAIRARSDDVAQIAHNTNMSKAKISRIKQHLFYDDTHILGTEERIGRFAPIMRLLQPGIV